MPDPTDTSAEPADDGAAMQHPFWHLGIVVADIDAAAAEIGPALGLTFGEKKLRSWGTEEFYVSMSRQGPPYFELLEGPPGSPWDGSQGARLDHISYWVDDLDGHRQHLEAHGALVELDGQGVGKPVNYHRTATTGIRLEPIAKEAKEAIASRWDISLP